MMAKRRVLLGSLLLVVFLIGCGPQADGLYQYSTINSLLEGVYDGELTCSQLLTHGDFGLGTFNGLDGEMVVVDGKVYKIKTDGDAYEMPADEKTPFAVVTFFEPDSIVEIESNNDWTLEKLLARNVPPSNLIQAIRVEGTFKYIKVRSVPRQTSPYARLIEVVKHQSVFELRNVRGTVLGFSLPAYMKALNVPGYHFHFITDDRTQGGHVLLCRPGDVLLKVDKIARIHVDLPQSGDFLKADLNEEKADELHKVEK